MTGWLDEIRPLMGDYFSQMPEADCGVARTSIEDEKTSSWGFYHVPVPGENDKGIYYYSAAELDKRCQIRMKAVVYHELLPGHHSQMNLVMEDDTLPDIIHHHYNTAYADGYDEAAGRYLGLVLGERPIVSMHEGLVVQREKALEQLAFDRGGDGGAGADGGSDAGGGAGAGGNGSDGGNAVGEGAGNGGGTVPPKPLPREVELEMLLDKNAAGYQVGSIVEEILQQLYDLGGANAELTFSAYVSVADGIDEQTQRVIKENANALGVTIRVR